MLKNKFKVGDRVRLRETERKGTVTGYPSVDDAINARGPNVTVEFDDGISHVLHFERLIKLKPKKARLVLDNYLVDQNAGIYVNYAQGSSLIKSKRCKIIIEEL